MGFGAMFLVKLVLFLQILAMFVLVPESAQAASVGDLAPAYPELRDGSVQYASLPRPLETYEKVEGGLLATFQARAAADPFNVAATVIFLLAILNTFAAGPLNKLSHRYEELHQQNLRERGPRDDEHPDGEPEVSFNSKCQTK